MSDSSQLTCKVVVVGQCAVGKTTLLFTLAGDKTGQDAYVAPVWDNVSWQFLVDNATAVTCGLWDTAGQDDYDRLRPLTYPGTDVFLICFAVDSPSSFERVRSKWVPEVQHHQPSVKYVLCALKTDLRDNPAHLNHLPISAQQGQALAEEIGAMAYFEMSSVRNEGVNQCFEGSLSLWLRTRSPSSRAGGLFSSRRVAFALSRHSEHAPTTASTTRLAAARKAACSDVY
jgi:small GTP-binding protein